MVFAREYIGHLHAKRLHRSGQSASPGRATLWDREGGSLRDTALASIDMTPATSNATAGLDQRVLARWYAVRVKSRHEKAVCCALRNKGLDEFLPLYRARHRWSDRTVDLQLPLFPGYVFCRFGSGNWLPILTTPGVLKIVSIGRTPAPVDDKEIEAIETVLKSGLAAYPWPVPRVGDRVVIDGGPLSGLEGILSGLRKPDRLVVTVTLLQRAVAVEIDGWSVRRAGGQPAEIRALERTPKLPATVVN